MSNRGQHWDDCDPDIRGFVERVVGSFRGWLGAEMVGAYLHGSLAMCCYRRAKSDLDLLFVVRGPGDVPFRRTLSLSVCDLSDGRPIWGDLELSVVQEACTRRFLYPTPFELHYSTEWKAAIRRGETDFAAERQDSDLAAHFTVTRARGTCLWGAPIKQVFAPVPFEAYRASVLADFEWIGGQQGLLESPLYGVLNICRTLQLLTEGEGTIASKEEGARWGLAHLPEAHRPLVRQALECYQSSAGPLAPENRKAGGQEWDKTAVGRFRDYTASATESKTGGSQQMPTRL